MDSLQGSNADLKLIEVGDKCAPAQNFTFVYRDYLLMPCTQVYPRRKEIAARNVHPSTDYAIVRLFLIVVVHQSDLQHLVAIRDHDSPGVAALPIDEGEPPDLISSPALLGDDGALDVQLTGGPAVLGLVIEPALLLVGVGDGVGGDELGAALELAEDVVGVLARLVVQGAQLRGAGEPARRGLLDVDVHDAVGVRVLLNVQVDRGDADGLAREPADALEGEDGLGVVGEGLVLEAGG